MAELATVEEALTQVLARVATLQPEPVSLELAAGRVLAEAPLARVDLPPFPSSSMDGFAVRAADAPGPLKVVGTVAAGRPESRLLGQGEAIGISTGGVVPDGADAVVPIEQVDDRGETVVVPDQVVSGANVRVQGGDVRVGAAALEAGTMLTPGRVAALAACGVREVSCARRPHVKILTTGSELRPPGAELGPGEIYESNGIMLEALLSAAGARVERLPSVADTEAAHRQALEYGLGADLLVTSGGVSVGPHDLVRRIEAELGVDEVFWGVAMRPGKPIAFGVRGSTLVFGLPGNPVSTLVGAILFVRPAVLALQGDSDPAPRFADGTLSAPLRRNPRRDDFVRARLWGGAGETMLAPIAGQESHMIVRAAVADALVHVRRGDGEVPAGSAVRYLAL